MIDIPLLDELRAIRRRLSLEQGLDVHRYAEMLRQFERTLPGKYITEPTLPQVAPLTESKVKHAG